MWEVPVLTTLPPKREEGGQWASWDGREVEGPGLGDHPHPFETPKKDLPTHIPFSLPFLL